MHNILINDILKLKNLKNSVLNLKHCRVERFKKAIEDINEKDKNGFFEKPVKIIKEKRIKGIIYWRILVFSNEYFAFTVLFPRVKIGNNKYEVKVYFKGKKLYPWIILHIQSVIYLLINSLKSANEA